MSRFLLGYSFFCLNGHTTTLKQIINQYQQVPYDTQILVKYSPEYRFYELVMLHHFWRCRHSVCPINQSINQSINKSMYFVQERIMVCLISKTKCNQISWPGYWKSGYTLQFPSNKSLFSGYLLGKSVLVFSSIQRHLNIWGPVNMDKRWILLGRLWRGHC